MDRGTFVARARGRCGIACALVALVACSPGQASKLEPHDAGLDGARDAKADAHLDAAGDASDEVAADATPEVEDTGDPDYGAPPAPGTHLEATIGPAGGTLAGADGTPLAHVSLVVPAGALATPTVIAIDLDVAPAMPAGASALSPFVRVGPDAQVFAVPARLTLPCATFAATSAVGGLAYVGAAWAALLSPSYDATAQALAVSMSRGAGAIAATLPDAPSPVITDFSPASAAIGDVVFVDGAGFGLAPGWLAGADGGAPRTAQILVGGVAASPLAWSDAALSLRLPAGAMSGAITVQTTSGQATSAAPIAVK